MICGRTPPGYDYYHRNAIFSRERFISSNADARRFGGRDTRSVNQPGNAVIALGGGDAGTFTVNTTNTTPSRNVEGLDFNLFYETPEFKWASSNSRAPSPEFMGGDAHATRTQLRPIWNSPAPQIS